MGAGVELMVMHLLTITSDGVASGIVRYAGNGAVFRSHGRIVCVMTWGTVVALVRQVLPGDLQPALSRGFGAIERTLSVLSVVSNKWVSVHIE